MFEKASFCSVNINIKNGSRRCATFPLSILKFRFYEFRELKDQDSYCSSVRLRFSLGG